MRNISLDLLTSAELRVTGRIIDASNASLLGEVAIDDEWVTVIYKPVVGERPLWDFPEGTLANREVAAFAVSELLGLHIVPPTVLRDGPFGIGAVQLWSEQDDNFDLLSFAQSRDDRLRSMVIFDALVNNTDRKFGHILMDGEQLLGCDHGVTFHVEDKLRTVLWQFTGEELTQNDLILLDSALGIDESQLRPLLSVEEIEAFYARAERLKSEGIYPEPSDDWPAVPWPPF